MSIWPRDARNGGTPIDEADVHSTVSDIQAKANSAQASGDHGRAAFLRAGADQELDTLNDIGRLRGHGFSKPGK
jgi:hypothetical protein